MIIRKDKKIELNDIKTILDLYGKSVDYVVFNLINEVKKLKKEIKELKK